MRASSALHKELETLERFQFHFVSWRRPNDPCMQGRWQVRRQVERQRSQHYPMPSLPLVSTGKTIWRSL